MGRRDQRWLPLPGTLSLAERDFYLELRRLTQVAGLSVRRLQQLTSTNKSDSAEASLYSKSQWQRWLNGEGQPPWKAIKKLTDKLSAEGIGRGQLLEQWHRAFGEIPPPRSAPSPPVRPRQLPASIPHFTGRAAELSTLNQRVEEATGANSAVVIVVIGGTAGVGKTALAVHWAHLVASRFPDGQLYVNLRGYDSASPPISAYEAIRGFLEALGVPAERIAADPEAQAAQYRSEMVGRQMLILLDNAGDAIQVRPLLPGSPGCLVLVTSRKELTGLVAADGARPLTLDVLSGEEARDLLVRRLGTRRIAAEPEAVDELIELCARLPLALNIAAARVAERPVYTIARFAADLRDLDALDTGEPAGSIRTVFSWSFYKLSPPAARMFQLLGLHPGPDISAPAAASLAGLSATRAQSLLAELAKAYLITEHVPDRYAFHDLLRRYASGLAATTYGDDERHRAVSRMLTHYLHTAYVGSLVLNPARSDMALVSRPEVTPETIASPSDAMAWFAAERHVLVAVITQANDVGLHAQACQLAWSAWLFFDREGHWHDQIIIQQTAIAAAKSMGSLAAQARANRDLGATYGRLGSLDEAREHCRQALELYSESGDRLGEARTHNELMLLAAEEGKHAEALNHARLSLALFREEGNEPGQAKMLNGVGWMLAQLEDYEQALEYCRQALGMYQDTNDPLNEAAAWDSVGYVQLRLGRYGQAISCLRTALDIVEELRPGYYQTTMLIHLGDAYKAIGELGLARQSWEKARTILDALQHSDIRLVNMRLAELDQDPRPENGL